MGKYAEKAAGYFHQGYNCAQSVLGAFSDVTGLDEKSAMKLASPFGGGMGGTRELCGAVSAMALVLAFTEGYDAPDEPQKKALYARIQALTGKFRQENGSLSCRELLSNLKPDGKTDRPCTRFVLSAAEILEAYL